MTGKIKIFPKAKDLAAGIAADTDEFEDAAKGVYNNIVADARQTADTGDFARSIRMDVDRYKSVKDRVIYSVDPQAYAIERGSRRVTKTGKVVEIPGKFIFRKQLTRGS